MPIGEITDTVDTFKNKVGAGGRGNLYRVEISFPPGLQSILDTPEEDFSILCTAATLPSGKVIETEEINYFGEVFKIDTGRGGVDDITLEFKNTENLGLRDLFEKWRDLVQQKRTGIKGAPEEYKVNNVYIAQLNRLKVPTYQIKVVGFFPVSVEDLSFSPDEKGTTSTSIACSIDDWEKV